MVSTHSRQKAAAGNSHSVRICFCCFNTQPPEGGCVIPIFYIIHKISFNTQPPEGGCFPTRDRLNDEPQLHSNLRSSKLTLKFQHTAARRRLLQQQENRLRYKVFQHTAARRRLHLMLFLTLSHFMFQHTAARRRLLPAPN